MSILGVLWSVLVPAATALIYHFLFSVVLKVQIPNYLLFILTGMIPWTFFTNSLNLGIECLVSNQYLLNKVPLPPQVLPFADTITNFINLLISLPVLIGAMLYLQVWPTWATLQYPFLLAALFLITYSLCLILSIAFVTLRDLRHIFGIVVQLWFYITPIMYAPEMIPEKYKFALFLNPVGTIFTGFHASLINGRWLSPIEWAAIVAWTAILFFASKTLLRLTSDSLAEIL